MSDYEQGYSDGLDTGYHNGYDKGVADEEAYWKSDYQDLEQKIADMEWEDERKDRDHEKEVDAYEKQIKEFEEFEETAAIEHQELEMKHDKLDEKFEDVMWELKQSWPEVIFDLQMKGIL